MQRLLGGLLLLVSALSLAAQEMPGILARQLAPSLRARDQFAKEQTLSSLMGPKGVVLLVFRSADWWPFCKQQLVQLQNARDKFRQEGVGLAAFSYDSAPLLEDFTHRHGIPYPLIVDPKSDIIRSYKVLNREATGFTKGMAHPGYFYVTPDGRVMEKFFETAYTDRYTAGNLVLKLFPELVEGNGREVAAQLSNRLCSSRTR